MTTPRRTSCFRAALVLLALGFLMSSGLGVAEASPRRDRREAVVVPGRRPSSVVEAVVEVLRKASGPSKGQPSRSVSTPDAGPIEDPVDAVVSIVAPLVEAVAPAPRSLRLVGTNPHAAAQPTATGRAITDLHAWQGRVYAGYGDYGANTGPITISSMDASGGLRDEFVQDSEAVHNFRTVAGRLVVPSIDPRVSADYATSGPWSERTAFGAAHVFDMTSLTGDDLWAVGSKGDDAVAWRSLDGGVNWAQVLSVAPRSPGGAARFYFAATLRGQLYVQASDSAGAHPTSQRFDGTAWSAGPALIGGYYTGWRPVEFEGRIVYRGASAGRYGPVFAFDGAAVKTLTWAMDVEVANGAVYVVGDGAVSRSTDLASWTHLMTAPSDAISLAVDGSTIAVGTASSAMFVSEG